MKEAGAYPTKKDERLNITIDETPDEAMPVVIEEVVDLFTGDTNASMGTTDLINGFLECVIVYTSKPVELRICLDDYPEIALLDVVNFTGDDYLPLRVPARDISNDRFNYSTEKWALNNTLRIEVKGAPNTETRVIVRYC
tara:strand:- start:600 stop:1019 length:420 start_codon:yes stop_codon:yes gene_type:complete